MSFNFLFEYNDYINNIDNTNKDDYIYNEILKRSKFGNLAIVEGLIFTHPLEKSIGILKRRFPELIIEIDNDDEIYIENQPAQELSKYLPIITNLGYFISKFTINGQEWFNKPKDNDKPIAFYIEAKYDYEVDIPKILYHASPFRLKHKILKYGLSPKSGSKLSEHPDRIYLTDDINKAIQFGEYLKTLKDNDWYKNGYCIYSVKGEGINKLYSDVNLREGGFYTNNNIKIEFVNLIKEVI
jgi:hypothetical protein